MKNRRLQQLFCVLTGAALLTQTNPDATAVESSDMKQNAPNPAGGSAPADKHSEKPEEGSDLVRTPAGPMRKGNVHEVGPNDEVRRQENGTYVVVPRRKPKSEER
jgi:hypothetical protein